MGCSSSHSQAPPKARKDSGEGENLTWATKTEVLHAGGPSNAGGNTAASRGGAASAETTKLVVADSDNESEIEIIYEGKSGKQAQKDKAPDDQEKQARIELERQAAANGQEAPDDEEATGAAEASATAKQEAAAAAEQEQAQLSARQKEEAAKLAEQRKRFDNQRYKAGNGGAADGAAAAGGSPGPTQSSPQAQQQDQAPMHDLVMGLNLQSPLQDIGQDDLGLGLGIADCLPGGIEDSPRVDEPTSTKVDNAKKHDLLDDEDENIMKEILETIDA